MAGEKPIDKPTRSVKHTPAPQKNKEDIMDELYINEAAEWAGEIECVLNGLRAVLENQLDEISDRVENYYASKGKSPDIIRIRLPMCYLFGIPVVWGNKPQEK